jgi:hypothetical protein
LALVSDSLFVIVSDDQRGDRRFVRVVPSDPAGLVEALARRVRNSYFDSVAALTRLNEAAAELTQFDGSDLTITEAELHAALDTAAVVRDLVAACAGRHACGGAGE